MNPSMTVGAFEAKTKFSELLERVSEGAEITITKHEKPVAKLVPFESPVTSNSQLSLPRWMSFEPSIH